MFTPLKTSVMQRNYTSKFTSPGVPNLYQRMAVIVSYDVRHQKSDNPKDMPFSMLLWVK